MCVINLGEVSPFKIMSCLAIEGSIMKVFLLRHSSASVYHTEHKPENKSRGGLEKRLHGATVNKKDYIMQAPGGLVSCDCMFRFQRHILRNVE